MTAAGAEGPTDAPYAGRLPTRVGRFAVPDMFLDLDREPGSLGALIAGAAAIFAAGLDPKIFGAGMPTVQAALRTRPEVESLFLLSIAVQAGFYLVGGALGDLVGRRRVLLVGLAGLLVGEVATLLAVAGPLFWLSRIFTAASIGLVIPVALATVAVQYVGGARATGLGLVYAAYGGATALSPALLLAVTPTIGRWPSLLLVSLVAALALFVAWRRAPNQPPGGLKPSQVVGHGLWAFGLLCLTASIVGLTGGSLSPIRTGLTVLGVVVLVAFFVWQRRAGRSADPSARIDIRPVTIALFAGVVIAFAQSATAVQAPMFFQIVQHWGPLAATIAIAPFVLALLLAGPVAGILLTRYRPRTLIAGGMAAVGLGDMAYALVSPSTPYLYFVIPLAAIGAGFVVGTTIRTAIIFASVPRRLPATAAALNETSLLLGGQLGVAVVTTLIGQFAMRDFLGTLAGQAADQVAQAQASFDSFLQAIGTSAFATLVDDLGASVAREFGASYGVGLSIAIAIIGAVTVVCAVIAWLGMGKQDSVTSVWEYTDERGTPAPAAAEAAAGSS